MAGTALIAVGGNSLIRAGQRGTIPEQLENAHATMRSIARMSQRGWSMVLTHGNGPQVGAALLRSERAAAETYIHPLDVCVATTQSEIGYLLQRALEYELRQIGLFTPVMTVLTQVRVEEDDPAFQNPAKPVGPFYSEGHARQRQRRYGWDMVEVPGRGWRRVVPSPMPVEIFEEDIVRRILGLGMIVIAVGGGGIPVIEKERHFVLGREAVIDKDRASALLAVALKVDLFLISTAVERVYLDYRKPSQRGLGEVTAREMKRHMDDGHFPKGSMGPKVEAALHYLERGGRKVVVTSPERLLEAVDGEAGTHIVP